ncbi:phage minor head protein [Desulforegula conservatrix]|uniref:phage minor head protein n=1 Tax=Desulforegula conservatrix TaxID=153026 RepID=UPI00041626DB|nr:phage minor head protein [Desulforegula conservatrix]
MLNLEPLAMQEAVDFWKSKILMSPSDYRNLSEEAKIRAFAVSGIARGAELETVFNSISRAIETGTTFDDFKRECASIFERRGWTGLGAWRIDNLFRTNIQTAYNVGRYRQMMEVADDRPYWMYDAVNDSRTRPAHRAMDGKVYRYDNPVWDTWYPLNGFRCRCSVTSLSESQVRRMGLNVEEGDPTNTLVETRDHRTGNVMPAFQLIPDPGFSYNPGRSAWGGIVDNSMTSSRNMLHTMPDLRGHADYRLPAVRNMAGLPELPELLPDISSLKAEGLTNSQVEQFYRNEFQTAFGITKGEEAILTAPDGESVIISERIIQGKGGRVKITKGDRGQYIPLFHDTASSPDEVWLTPMKDDSGKILLRRRQFKFWRGQNENVSGFAVLDFDKGVWTGVSIYDVQDSQEHPVDMENLLDGPLGYRRGLLLYKKKKA